MLTPKIDFAKTESLKGPWEVYKSSLFSEASKPTIENNLFDDLHNSKFTAIYVYYTNDLEPLLVVFISDSGNKFFRLKKGGKSWENINNFNIIDYDGDLIEKLRQIETEKKPPDTEALPKPGPVKRQEGSDTSQYQRALGGDQPSLTTATASILPGRQSSQRPESTQSRSFGSTAVTSQTTDSTTQRSKVALSPPQPARTTFLHTPQKGQDTGVPSTQLSTSFKLSVTTGREPSHTERTDRRGEMGTGLQNTHNLNEISLEGKGDQGIYTQIQSTPNDQNFSYSSSHLNPHSEPQLSDDKKDDDNNDESISKTAKIAGGVAGTAIGAGAIGVGAHYAHGVASLTHWLV
ncbi:hypothetical protein MACJ_002425 [Theileria orientalis]|uniref:Uncharacterized protein n=1 Tax=Theileria orientalis TaxID=68886 RepID=A0A976M666_THEOR|nr:hypothetical protein MACJ_002425 [Theileria orientalis]